LLTNSSLLGSTYGGSRPVTRSVNSVPTTRTPTTRRPIFTAFTIFVLRCFYDRRASPSSRRHEPRRNGVDDDANHTISSRCARAGFRDRSHVVGLASSALLRT